MKLYRRFLDFGRKCRILLLRDSYRNGHYTRFPRHYATKPPNDSSVSLIGELIHASNSIVVLCGAGISTASGIPDFRTEGTGLYDKLNDYELDHPTDVFDLRFFHKNPRPFFRLAKSLYPGNHQPNDIHLFLKLLSTKRKLLTVYTQNIDCLESLAGVPDEELVYAHGSFNTATCLSCHKKYKGEQIKDSIMANIIPKCLNENCKGIVKPDVVFFGEDLPDRFHANHQQDLSDCDFLLVLGTSLEVYPVAGLVFQVSPDVPRVLINGQLVDPFKGDHQTRPNDVVLCMDLLYGVHMLLSHLRWLDDLKQLQNK